MACAGSMPPSGSVRDGLCSFIGSSRSGHLDLRLHLFVDRVYQLEHFLKRLASKVLEYRVHQGQGNLNFLIIHGLFSKASLKWGSDGTPCNYAAGVAQGKGGWMIGGLIWPSI
jgi:hypothetical protein